MKVDQQTPTNTWPDRFAELIYRSDMAIIPYRPKPPLFITSLGLSESIPLHLPNNWVTLTTLWDIMLTAATSRNNLTHLDECVVVDWRYRRIGKIVARHCIHTNKQTNTKQQYILYTVSCSAVNYKLATRQLSIYSARWVLRTYCVNTDIQSINQSVLLTKG